MFHIEIFSAATPPPTEVESLEEDYLRRLKSECKIEKIGIKSRGKGSGMGSPFESRSSSRTPVTILLHEKGTTLNSVQFSKMLQGYMNRGISGVRFAIGPAEGWKQSELEQADKLISLSELTFTAHFARLILIEQIYRAFSILKGSSYHRE